MIRKAQLEHLAVRRAENELVDPGLSGFLSEHLHNGVNVRYH